VNDKNTINPDTMLSDEIRELLSTNTTKKDSNINDLKKQVDVDFIKAGSKFWVTIGKNYSDSYDKGEMISNFNTVSAFSHLSLFMGLLRVLQESIKEDLLEKEVDTTEIKEIFKILESTLKMLSYNIESSIEKSEGKKPLDTNVIFSALHGFINSYIQKSIIEK